MKTERVWSEEDEERCRADRKRWQHSKIEKLRAEAQKKYDTNYENYQSTGAPAQERACRRWEDVLEVCNLAESALDQTCVRCELRRKNARSMGERLEERKKQGETTISIDEAIGLAYQFM